MGHSGYFKAIGNVFGDPTKAGIDGAWKNPKPPLIWTSFASPIMTPTNEPLQQKDKDELEWE